MQTGFDWERVLRELRIDYTTRGKNVSKGELNIKCPWCGPNDPSHHLGINPAKGAYRCWRNKTAHSGYSASYLLTKLVGRRKTLEILRRYGLQFGSTQHARSDAQRDGDTDEGAARPLNFVFPHGVYRFDPAFDTAFSNYLVKRGFAGIDTAAIAEQFQLHVGRHGTYASRLVIPYIVGGRCVHFTARAITDARLRFQASPSDLAVYEPHNLVFNGDALDNPAGVLLVEGPLDAIKASVYGPLPAVALSTNTASKDQIQLLKRARRIIILTDNDNVKTHGVGDVSSQALGLYWQLMRAGVSVMLRPMMRGFKDLAEIHWKDYPRLVNVETLLATVN